MSNAAPSEPIVDAQNLGRRYGNHNALIGVSLQIRKGEILGVLGPDGAGKTTLLQLFAAILDPTSGQCRSLGFDTVQAASSVTSRIGYMSQGFTLYDRLTVDENLRFSGQIRGVTGETWHRRRNQVLAMAGLAEFIDRRADRLSGGMRKKLALCANLIHRPPLLLLDEPSLGVDPLSRRELWDMLRSLRHGETTIVVATSYMDEALFCDRLALLSSGRLVALGTPSELQARAHGAVYEIIATDLDGAEEVLSTRPYVVAIQRLPGRLRVQVDQGKPATADALTADLAGFGEARRVPPSLEDAFAGLAGMAKQPAHEQPPGPQPVTTSDVAAINAVHVTYRFGRFIALDDVSLHVPQGEVFGFLGPNGAGKTTFIRALCGLIDPASGVARVAGIDVAREKRHLRQCIGYMSQRFSLYPDLTAAENLTFFAGAYGLSGEAKDSAIEWASQTVGLGGLQDRRVAELSGAIRQRLALACSIMHRPAVLFLDEPTSGVDPSSRHRFWRLIHVLARSGMTVFVTTHYLEEAIYCHRLGLMYQGRLIAIGTIDSLRTALADPSRVTLEEMFMAYIERERRRQGISGDAAQ